MLESPGESGATPGRLTRPRGQGPHVCEPCPARTQRSRAAESCCVYGEECEETRTTTANGGNGRGRVTVPAESSEAGEGPLFGPVLDLHLSEREVKHQAEHVDGRGEEEDISPAGHGVLEAEHRIAGVARPFSGGSRSPSPRSVGRDPDHEERGGTTCDSHLSYRGRFEDTAGNRRSLRWTRGSGWGAVLLGTRTNGPAPGLSRTFRRRRLCKHPIAHAGSSCVPSGLFGFKLSASVTASTGTPWPRDPAARGLPAGTALLAKSS